MLLCPLPDTHSEHICLVRPLLGALTLDTALIEVSRLGQGVIKNIFLLLGFGKFKSSCSGGIRFRFSCNWLAKLVFRTVIFR